MGKANDNTPRPMSLQTSAKDSKNLQLLDVVKHGDLDLLIKFLRKNPTLGINVEDEYLKQYPLKIAVQLQKDDIVEYILNIPGVQLKDSLLHAIITKNVKIISRIWECPQSHSERGKTFNSADFPLYLFAQPLILACHNNHYASIYYFMSKDDTRISRDHMIRDKLDYRVYFRWWREALCGCRQSYDDEDDESDDGILEKRSMAFEREQLDCIRAAASPVYLSLCCLMDESDLFLDAFCLCHEADIYKKQYPIYFTEYHEVRQNIGKFLALLLEKCQTQREVECILRKHHRESKLAQSSIPSDGKYPRLKLAMQWEIKEVVTHRNCQQVLEGMWTGGHPILMQVNIWTWFCFFLPRLLVLPFVYLVLFIYPEAFTPKGKSEKLPYWKTPMAKFSSDMISYGIFLILLAVDVWASGSASLGDRAPDLNGGLDVVIFIYMLSYVFEGIEAMFLEGFRIMFSNWWMLHLMVMNTFFLIYMGCRLVSYIITLNEDDIYTNEPRSLWGSWDVQLWSECAYSLSIVLAFVKILYIFQDTKTFGPLQLSLAFMILEISKTLIIYTVILIGFTFGMARLYEYYADMVRIFPNGDEEVQPEAFNTVYESLLFLFWVLLGSGSPDSALVIVSNVCANDTSTACSPPRYHQVVESTGYLLYVAYQMIGGIILMRMLIALMSAALSRIQKEEDTEWKFSRARLWLTYFEQRSIFPNPLNVIPSPWGIYQSFKWCLSCRQNREEGITDCCYPTSADVSRKSQRESNDQEYKKLVKRLAIGFLSGLEQQNLERSQLVELVQGTNNKRFRSFAAKALSLDRKMSEEAITEKEEEGITPSRPSFLGAIKNKVKGKLTKTDSITSERANPDSDPDKIHLEEIQKENKRKKRPAPIVNGDYQNPAYEDIENDRERVSEASSSDSDNEKATDA